MPQTSPMNWIMIISSSAAIMTMIASKMPQKTTSKTKKSLNYRIKSKAWEW